MPVDFSEYINLAIFDKEPGDIYRDAIELGRLTMPDFNLRVGTPEDAIFQAAAYISALNINAINRLPDRLMAGIVTMLGYERQQAIPAEVNVEITLGSYGGGTVPVGTVFSYDSLFEDEAQQYAFVLLSALEIGAVDPLLGEYPSAVAKVTSLEAGVIPPLAAGTELTVVTSGTDIVSAVIATPSNFLNGLNADADVDYLSKATTYMRSLTSTLVRAAQVDAYLLTTYPGVVTRAKTYDLTDGDFDSGDLTVKRSIGVTQTHVGSTVATIQTASPHLFVVGDVIELDFNGSTITSAAGNGTLITYTTSTSHALLAGQSVTVEGVGAITGYNGTFTINTVPTATTFTVTNATTGTATYNGALTKVRLNSFSGQHTITHVPTTTTFRFTKTGTSASASISGSAYAGQDVPGFVSVVGYGNNTMLTETQKVNILADVQSKSVAGLTINVVDPALVTLLISGTIAISQRYDQESLSHTIEDALVDYLSPANYPLNIDRIRHNQIVALISNIPGVVYVSSLTLTPAEDGWLPQYGDDLLFRYKGSLPVISLEDITFTYTTVEVTQ